MPRLSKALGGPNLWIKRDDCTGLATGGNKTRKLEFLLAEAQQQHADVIVTPGAYQSNHVRQTAAAAARLGIECRLVVEHRLPDPDPDYMRSGNRFLDDLFGAVIEEVPYGEDAATAMESRCAALSSQGRKVYTIPGGGSNATGALAYARCALEILDQAAQRNLRIDHVVHATGSGGTQAGLVTGFEATSSGIPVLGFSVHQRSEDHVQAIETIVQALADRLGVGGGIDRSAIHIDDDHIGPGYGVPTDEMVDAVGLVAQLEGVLLDPVYSGKAMAGLIAACRSSRFKVGENVVFLHTGGTPGLFAYIEALGRGNR